MKLLTYKYNDVGINGWNFSKVTFGKINLLVGTSGSGKTRFLNTLFNIGSSIADPKAGLRDGHWEMDIQIQENKYSWMIDVIKSESTQKPIVNKEKLIDNIKNQTVFERDNNKFFFQGKELPKLSVDQSGLKILSDEEIISPIIAGFSSILRKHFSMDALIRVTEYGSLPDTFYTNVKDISIEKILSGDFPLNLNLYLLNKYFPAYFEEICKNFKSVFPFIENIKIVDLRELNKSISIPGLIPTFCIQEKGNPELIQLRDLSSGMQKVLLILTDYYILPPEGIYLLDEYENSLGTNAIDFLPNFLKEQDNKHQYIITSHHPYLISNIPTKNWFVFHREKKNIDIQFGNAIVDKYGKSKQDAFSQLMNDPFYFEGVK
ncbi:MAG TPA: ATP-binding protein [Anaerolineaceae bacterium]|nr:ATP-binding protein [Anaerolineaceae bacterium]